MNLSFRTLGNKFGLPPLTCQGFDDPRFCAAYGGSGDNPHFTYGTGNVPNLPPYYGNNGNGDGGSNNGSGITTTTTITTADGQQIPAIFTNTNPDLLTQLRSLVMANQGISLGLAVVLGYLILKK